jgi:hypothetical protein
MYGPNITDKDIWFILILLGVFGSLGLWKLVEIIYWLVTHVRVVF